MKPKNTLSFFSSRRAAIELSLHWIFVIVIGAIILTFFITLVVKQKSISQSELLNERARTLESYITGAQTTTRGAIELSTFGNPFRYSCAENSQSESDACTCTLVVGEKPRQSIDVGSSVLFAPAYSGKTTDSLIVWSVPWRMPYPVTNFVYFTTPDIEYVFVYDKTTPIGRDLETIFTQDITEKISKRLVNSPELKNVVFADEGYQRRVIVVVGRTLEHFRTMTFPSFVKNEGTTILYTPSLNPSDLQTGEVYYFNYDADQDAFVQSGSSKIMGLPSFFGAFFVDDTQSYDCMMSTAFRNLRSATTVQLERTKILNNDQICAEFYGQGDQKLFEDILAFTDSPQKWHTLALQELLTAVDNLQRLNDRIEDRPCPLLY